MRRSAPPAVATSPLGVMEAGVAPSELSSSSEIELRDAAARLADGGSGSGSGGALLLRPGPPDEGAEA